MVCSAYILRAKQGIMAVIEMKLIKAIFATMVVSVGVALTYSVFEWAVRVSTSVIWTEVFQTDSLRWVVLPLCLVLSLLFFGAQHILDPKSEARESKGLGETPQFTGKAYIQVLFIGFLSLLAGASLGPEAILVPASLIIGGLVGDRVFKRNQPASNLLAMVGFVALFAAFFHSFAAGLIGLLLVLKEKNLKLNAKLLAFAVLASLTTVAVLSLVPSRPLIDIPDVGWVLNIHTAIALVFLLVAGYGVTFGIKFLHDASRYAQGVVARHPWWAKAIVAALGLTIIYWLGGPLVEFTGNEAINPMLQQASALGLAGLAWMLVVKMAAIGWSKASHYRGGMVFPTILVASILVAIIQVFLPDVSLAYGLIAVLVGVIIADQKAQFLL